MPPSPPPRARAARQLGQNVPCRLRRRRTARPRAPRRAATPGPSRTPAPAPPSRPARARRRPSGGPSACRPAGTRRSRQPAPRPPLAPCPAARPGWPAPSPALRRRRPARPVRIRSSARPSPTMRGKPHRPPSISGTPHRRQNTPSTASDSTTRRSHHSASSRPPATACPLIAAITGFDSAIRDGPIGPSADMSGSRALDIACRSAPAQNVPPAPHNTATRASVAASNARNASASAAAVAPSTALRRSGRSRTIVHTACPAFSTCTGTRPTPPVGGTAVNV